MAGETRVASRREPIRTSVAGVKPIFEASPLPWRKRNDYGSLMAKTYVEGLNKVIADASGTPVESVMDYEALLTVAYPNVPVEVFSELDFEQMVFVLTMALEVNGLDRMAYMLEPSKVSPATPQTEDAGTADGQKIASLPALSSVESDDETSNG